MPTTVPPNHRQISWSTEKKETLKAKVSIHRSLHEEVISLDYALKGVIKL
jgi:hypothetical protein